MGPPDAAPTPLYATGPGNTYRPETTPAVRRRRVNHDSDSDSSTVSATSTTSSSSGSIELNHPRYQEDPQDVIFRKKQRKGKKIKRKPSRHRRRSSLGSLPRTASLASLRSEIDFVEQREDKSGSALKALLELYEDLKARVRKLEPEHQPHDENPATSEKTDKSVKPALDETGDDGDDEGANDEKADDEKNVDDEEQAPGRKFDLATQLFYRPDEEDQRLFNDTVIYPFIRVRWDDLYSSGPEAILEDPKNKGDYSAGSVGLNEICIDSPVFKHFIEEYADSLTVQPPPPPKILGNEDHTISFYKPFRWLIQNQEVFKDKVKSLEQEKQNQKDLTPVPVEPSKSASDKSSPEKSAEDGNKDGASGESNVGTESLEHDLLAQLQFFLNFMDEHLAGPIKRYEEARAGKLKTIAFEDLWMLFKPGDVIFTPFRRGSPASINPAPPPPPPPGMRPGTVGQRSGGIVRQGIGRDTPQAYRIISVLGGRHFAVPLGDKAKKTNVYSQLKVLCYYIDFNGLRYDCVSDVFNFRPFENEVEITNLDAYPLAYASIDEKKGKEQMTEYLKRRGQQFVEVSEVSHKLYEGLAFGATREEINTPVIIDFALAYQNTPGLRPQFTLPTVDFFNQTMRNTRAELFEAVIQTRTGRKFDWYWRQQTGLTTRGRTELLETLDDYPSVKSTDAECISKLQTLMESNGQILLLPGMVHAFALRNRKWVSLELSLVQNSQYEDGWKDLILPPGHKEMVRAVVENHATGSRSTVGMAKGTTEVDIVRGKGKGCIILLHGEPGVGKTSTAECVAAFTKRPLFPITCGDIGYEPDEVERNLEKHFTLAHKWGCVMLLDEADVFLAKRSRDDIKRNGLVSVFLRILEYYPGILFLTTNRVGSFDDAFRSRLHLTLYYPKLDKRQTIQIWDMNLRRVSEANENRALAGQQSIDIHHDKIIKFAKKNWETLSWNGRQIRNAFQTAIALAEFDVRDGNGKQAVMSKKQFKTIAKASMQFDDYLFHVHGGTDESANARKEQVRWDYEVMDRPGTKRELSDSDSDLSSDSSSSSSGSSSDDSDDSDDVSSDDAKKRRKKKKGKEKEREREKERKSKKKSDDRGKKSKSKKDKH